MIEIHFYQRRTDLLDSERIQVWLNQLMKTYNSSLGEINVILHSDESLHKLNVEKLNHDTLTDIITDDFVVGDIISGDLHVSLDRVLENAKERNESELKELLRVVAHGALHLLKFKDKTHKEKKLMREAEDNALSQYSSLFHVEL